MSYQHELSTDEITECASKYYDLWNSKDKWIKRGVMQQEYIDDNTVRFKWSYDIMLGELAHMVPENENHEIIVPFQLVSKKTFSSMDINGIFKGRMCLATRAESAKVLTYLIIGRIIDADVPVDKINMGDVKGIYDILHHSDLPYGKDGYHSRQALEMLKQLSDETRENTDIKVNERSWSWKDWIKDREFRQLFRATKEQSLLCVSFPVVQEMSIRSTIKLCWEESIGYKYHREGSYGPRWKKYISWSRSQLRRYGVTPPETVLAGINFDPKFGVHTSLIVPPGMRVRGTLIESLDDRNYDEKLDTTELLERKELEETYKRMIRQNISDHRVSVYSPSGITTEFSLRIFLDAKRALFAFPAFVASLTSLIVAFLEIKGLSLHAVDNWEDSLSSIVTVMALVPALMASYMALSEEHDQFSVALGVKRSALMIGLGVSLTSTLIVSLDVADKVIGTTGQSVIKVNFLLQAFLTMFFILDIIRSEHWKHSITKRPAARRTFICLELLTMAVLFYFIYRWSDVVLSEYAHHAEILRERLRNGG